MGGSITNVFVNFLLVTIVGGVFTFVLSALRDEEVKRQSVLTAIRDLVRQVDELFRSTKQIKRMIRSRINDVGGDRRIEAGFFALRMEELSNTQLKIEQARNVARTRPDLFAEERQSRILKELEYSDKYLHDVVEEFEKRQITWTDEICTITSSCCNLNDFWGPRWKTPEIAEAFRIMEDADTSAARFAGFESIVDIVKRLGPDARRRKSISDECLLLAMREMRDEILQSRPRFTLEHLFSLLPKPSFAPRTALASGAGGSSPVVVPAPTNRMSALDTR
jgi:hypothetical protein